MPYGNFPFKINSDGDETMILDGINKPNKINIVQSDDLQRELKFLFLSPDKTLSADLPALSLEYTDLNNEKILLRVQ